MSHFNFHWTPKFPSGCSLMQLVLTAVLGGGWSLNLDSSSQSPSFHLSILFHCFIDARFIHIIAGFCENEELTSSLKEWSTLERQRSGRKNPPFIVFIGCLPCTLTSASLAQRGGNCLFFCDHSHFWKVSPEQIDSILYEHWISWVKTCGGSEGLLTSQVHKGGGMGSPGKLSGKF